MNGESYRAPFYGRKRGKFAVMSRRSPVVAALLALALSSTPAHAQRGPDRPGIDHALATELGHRLAVDQAGRDSLAIAVAAHDTLFLRRLMARDSASTAWLRDIVARHGWPGKRLVGDSGAEAAFLLLQHSPDAAFQAKLLPRLWAAARSGDLPAAQVAMLDDRVTVHSGRPQTYGSSFGVKDSCLTPDSMVDPAHVDARRAKVGLPSMAEYGKMLGEMYKMPVSLSGPCRH